MSDTLEIKTAPEVPPRTFNRGSKYDPLFDEAIRVKPQAAFIAFEDSETANSRSGAIRTAAERRDENLDVTVRGSNVYVTAN